MSALVVTLPGLPPSVNKMYTRTHGGGQRLSDAAQAWRDHVMLQVGCAALAAGWVVDRCSRWTLHMVVRVPAWNRDIDNMVKLTADGIARAIGVDDRYLVRLVVERESGPARTQLTIGLAE